MLAIAGGKGGCGKTTTALGVANALADSSPTEPVVVDADTEMPDLHVVADTPIRPGLAALARGDARDTVTHRTRIAGVRAVPAGDIGLQSLSTALERIRGTTAPTIIDCPAGAARDAALPLRAADRTLLVTTPEAQCLADTVKTAAMARTLDAPPLGVVVNHPRTEAGAVTAPQVRTLFECPFLGRVPPGGNRPLTCPNVRSAFERVGKKINKRNI